MFGALLNFFQPAIEGVDFITPEQARQALENGEIKALLDVRTPSEYSQARIPGSRHIPLDVIQASVDNLSHLKDHPVLVYCHTQNRSRFAAKILSGAGFRNLKVMSGGISQWARDGYPIEN